MTRKTKKLALNKETLKQLDERELVVAAGGVVVGPGTAYLGLVIRKPTFNCPSVGNQGNC